MDDPVQTSAQSADPAAALVAANGGPARPASGGRCPGCGASKEKRVASGAFGPNRHDVCSQCGYEFQELTCG